MKKKGFTLVELLAVIAILAILVIIALPNILGLFNDSKKNSFLNEAKEIYKTAKTQYVSDSMLSSGEKIYIRSSEKCTNQLNLSGRENIYYYIKIDAFGNVVEYAITDEVYQYSYSGSSLKIEDITEAVEISKIENEEEKVTISCLGASGGQIPKHLATFINRQDPNSISPGDELKILDENFYVISSNPNGDTVLLTKYYLNTSKFMQSENNFTTLPFSLSGYWDYCSYNQEVGKCTAAPVSTINPIYSGTYCWKQGGVKNCAYVFDNNSIINGYINNYAQKMSSIVNRYIAARLLSVEEAYSMIKLGENGENIILSSLNGTYYWLGSAGSNKGIHISSYSKKNVVFDLSNFWEFNAVRPVIIVETSSL